MAEWFWVRQGGKGRPVGRDGAMEGVYLFDGAQFVGAVGEEALAALQTGLA